MNKILLEYYLEDKQVAFFLEDLVYVKTYKSDGFGYEHYSLALILKDGQIHLSDSSSKEGIRNDFDEFIEWYREVIIEE